MLFSLSINNFSHLESQNWKKLILGLRMLYLKDCFSLPISSCIHAGWGSGLLHFHIFGPACCANCVQSPSNCNQYKRFLSSCLIDSKLG